MEKIKGDVIAPHIRAWRADFRRDRIRITILKEIVGIQTSVVDGFIYRDEEENGANPVCMTLDATHAQTLMDDLWECGVRPSEGTGSAGSLKATQNHLADIKQILFQKLGINKDK